VLAELKIVVRRAHEYAVLKRELENVRRRLIPCGCDRLIGSSSRFHVVYDLISRVASLNAPVLITGESGTGKELIARAIHNLGDAGRTRSSRFPAGQFPRRSSRRNYSAPSGERSRVRPPGGAAIWKRRETERCFSTRSGSSAPARRLSCCGFCRSEPTAVWAAANCSRFGARLLFATHRNLQEMVANGTFRQDLYYRVNVFGIKSPGLRDHSEDIPLLALHFLEKYARQYNRPTTRIAPSTMALLIEYEWPGNVRELENVIQGGIILSDNESIQPKDLPPAMQHPELLGHRGLSARRVVRRTDAGLQDQAGAQGH
jgi:DNA-binding NtrC family response regulator